MMSQAGTERLSAAATTPFERCQGIGRQSFGLGSVVFIAVLWLRLLALGRLSASALLLPLGGDMYFYNDWAHRILRGGTSDQLAFYGLPGYAYLLAFLYKIFGYNPWIAGLLQALLDSGTAWLVYRVTLCLIDGNSNRPAAAANRLWPLTIAQTEQGVAFLAALGWAFFVPAQAYSAILMPTSWLVFSFWLVVWRVIRKETAPSSTECLLLGLLIGMTATAVATILFLIPLVAAARVFKPSLRQLKQALLGVILLGLGVLSGTAPCWVRNYFFAHDQVVLSAHSGINFWIGNNPEANGYPHFPPGLRAGQAAMLEDSINAAELAVGRPLKRSEVSKYWSNQATTYIRQHPFEWLRLLLLKLYNTWNAFQYDDLSIITNLREGGIILPGVYYGVVAAFAFPGILLIWRTSSAARWVVAAILLHVTALLSVFVTERYRLAVVPGLLCFAAAGLFIFWRSLIARKLMRVAAYLGLLSISTIFTSWPRRDPTLWALDAYNSGWRALESGNLVLAEKKLSLAQSYVPTNPETNFALGNLRHAQRQNPLAAQFYLATLKLDADHRGALNNLGVISLEERNYEAAETWFRRAIRVEPRNGKLHFLLAKAAFEKGEREEARSEIERAISLNPGQDEFKRLKQRIESSSAP